MRDYSNNGRPKGSKNKKTLGLIKQEEIAAKSLKELVLPYCQAALNTLIELLASDNEAVRYQAANGLLDRGYGKAIQYQESKSVVITATVTPVEAARKAAFMLDHAERLAISDETASHKALEPTITD